MRPVCAVYSIECLDNSTETCRAAIGLLSKIIFRAEDGEGLCHFGFANLRIILIAFLIFQKQLSDELMHVQASLTEKDALLTSAQANCSRLREERKEIEVLLKEQQAKASNLRQKLESLQVIFLIFLFYLNRGVVF